MLIVAAWLCKWDGWSRHAYEAPVPWPPISLDTDPRRQWKGIYYRGEKIGFSVGQTVAKDGGYQVIEDGRMQLNLLGTTSGVRLHSEAFLDGALPSRPSTSPRSGLRSHRIRGAWTAGASR
jgi:hypothetical protein